MSNYSVTTFTRLCLNRKCLARNADYYIDSLCLLLDQPQIFFRVDEHAPADTFERSGKLALVPLPEKPTPSMLGAGVSDAGGLQPVSIVQGDKFAHVSALVHTGWSVLRSVIRCRASN
jgi:hypothetical protein